MRMSSTMGGDCRSRWPWSKRPVAVPWGPWARAGGVLGVGGQVDHSALLPRLLAGGTMAWRRARQWSR
eukprot:2590711-Rhodomonas_salina.1